MHKINEQYKYTHPHTHGMSVLTPTYTDQVVVTIKSLATGQTMQVYLDEPTQSVEDGINITTYAGHFNEENFMYTPSEGFEITGFPLVYQYSGNHINTVIPVVDTQNHSLIYRNSDITNAVDLIQHGLSGHTMMWSMFDFDPDQEWPTSGNVVVYEFSRSSGTSEEPIVAPVNPDEDQR